MSTYVQIRNRIADDVRAATSAAASDISSQIAQCVLLAIKHYRHERLWFNETSATSTTTASSAQVAAPSDIVEVDRLYIVISSRNIELIPKDLNTILECRPTTNGQPRAYAYYRNQFELDRPAASAYTLLLYYIKELTELSADADTNGWTTDAEDLIVFHAEKKLYANVVKDMAKAAQADAQERAALTALRALRRARTSTGYTKAHYL